MRPTHSTPRSVRQASLQTMTGLISANKKISVRKLRRYIMREFNISSETFEKYLQNLEDIGLITLNGGHAVWVNEDLGSLTEDEEKK